MARPQDKGLISKSLLTAIGDQLRRIFASSSTYSPSAMATALSGITRRTDSGNVTLDGSTTSKSYAAGYYPNAHGAAHSLGSIAVNTPSVNSSGLVTASAALSTAGYIGSAPASKTLQLTTQAAKTVTPSASSQTAVASGVYTTGAVTVAAVPVQNPATITDNGTYTPASGKWFNSVTVAIPFQVYRTGSGAPPASLGNDGDLYFDLG